MKLHYQPPRPPEIIPEPFRRLGKRRGPGRNLIAAAVVLLLAAAIGWIWWHQRQSGDLATNASRTSETNRAAPKFPSPQPVLQQPETARTIVPTQPTTIAPTNARPTASPIPPEADPDSGIRLQVALARFGFSPGPIDGIVGAQTRSALRSFQKSQGLRPTGVLDAATRQRLATEPNLYTNYTVTASDIARLRPAAASWLAKSRQDRMEYASIVELLAEKSQSDEDLLWRLNPQIDWTRVGAGTTIRLPEVNVPAPGVRAAAVHIHLAERSLEVAGAEQRIIAHFPCSIGQRVEKRPIGALHVTSIAPNPNYTFDPAIFPESAEAQQIGRKLILQPGPNNPVGTVWIGLDRPGYGIHGTPLPEKVGRTESHGCFRLANWNAEYLLKLAWVGMPVYVEE